MTTLLPKTKQPRRKNRIVVLRAELRRETPSPVWLLRVSGAFQRPTTTYNTGTPHEAAAREFAQATIRHLTRQQPAASSQQPAASSQQPAASSQP